jgi:integrase
MATRIYKRGNVWWIRYTGIDGKQKRESVGKNYKNAVTKLAQRQTEVKNGQEPEVKRVPNYSFTDLAERYRAWIEGRQKSAKVKGYIIGQLNSKYATLSLRRFNTALVEQLQTDLINLKYKAASNNKVLNVLKHMFRKAVDWEMVETETLKRVGKVALLKDDSKRLRYLTKEECQGLIKACSIHLKPIVIAALNTGMRRGEILSLKWEQVDLVHGFILLNRTKNGERREIPINETLKATLKELPSRFLGGYVFGEIVEKESMKSCIPYQDVKRSFNTALRKACIMDFHFHDLRHTFASHLIMAGVDITTVSKLLGHKSLAMTLRYSHLAPSHMVKAVDILDNTLNEKMISTKLAQSEAGK